MEVTGQCGHAEVGCSRGVSGADSPATPSYRLREMVPADSRVTAALHIEHLSYGFFPRLGRRFMERWHRTFLDTESGSAMVLTDANNQIVAFVLFTTDQQKYLDEVLHRHRLPLLSAGVPALLARPGLLVLFLRTRLRKYHRRLSLAARGEVQEMAPGQPDLGIVHAIVTVPSARRQGYGRVLLEAALTKATDRGATMLALVTAADDQPAGLAAPGAEGFYERLGWARTAVRERDAHTIVEFRMDLTLRPHSG